MKRVNLAKIGVALAVAMLGGLAFVGLTPAAWADDNSSESSEMTYMTVSPMSQQIILQPGEVYNGSVKISNSAGSRGPLKYSVKVGSFSQHADEDSEDDYGVIDTQAVSSYNQGGARYW